jgi:hypothetical protein
MIRRRNQMIGIAATVLVTAAVIPAASLGSSSANERTPAELGQAVGEPGEGGGATVDARYERTPAELGQAVGEPGEGGGAAVDARYERTPAELGQRVLSYGAPGAGAGGFGWSDAAIGTGGVLGVALIGVGTAAVLSRRRRARSALLRAAAS